MTYALYKCYLFSAKVVYFFRADAVFRKIYLNLQHELTLYPYTYDQQNEQETTLS